MKFQLCRNLSKGITILLKGAVEFFFNEHVSGIGRINGQFFPSIFLITIVVILKMELMGFHEWENSTILDRQTQGVGRFL